MANSAFALRLHVGDIIAVTRGPVGGGPIRLLKVDHIDPADGQARGFVVESDGTRLDNLWVFQQWNDRLVACGRDEDCRAHIDLAMACALHRGAARERPWTRHQVSGGRSE